MLNLLEAIKLIIERYVVGKTPITSSLSKGDTVVPVKSSRRFNCGDTIAIYNKPSTGSASIAELRTITDIPNNASMILDTPLNQNYPQSTSGIEKCHYGTFVDGVYIGNPPVLPGFPSICIELDEKQNNGLTLESTSEETTILIWIFSLAADYDSQYKLMVHYAQQIEESLWRTHYPLAKPYAESALAEDAFEGATIIKLTEPLYRPNVFIEGTDRLGYYRLIGFENEEYTLATPLRHSFDAGDKVISPERHFYSTMPQRIKYGTINSEPGPLKAALLIYEAREELRRYGGTRQDPITY